MFGAGEGNWIVDPGVEIPGIVGRLGIGVAGLAIGIAGGGAVNGLTSTPTAC
jgi:hypothetical protein